MCDAGSCTLVSIDGGAILQADVKDGGQNGAGDTVAITVNRSSKLGGIWFSSQWGGTKTIAKSLSNGDIAVQ